MKEVVRTVDELGRIVLPAEYRQILHIAPMEKVQVTLLPDGIVIKKAN